MIYLFPGGLGAGGNKTGAAVRTFSALQDVSDLIKINKTINFQFKFYLEEGETVKHQKHTILPYDQTLPAGSTRAA